MELDDFSGCNDDDRHLIMIKGHRTKRPRPVSQAAAVSVYSDDDEDDSNETGESTVEDEIMANCLIYLAHSGGGCIRRQEKEEEVKLLGNVSDSSRTEIIINKELFVYECKTCNRNFPSFQALGGHRASHKRPKFLLQGDKKPIFTTTTSTQNHHHHEEDEDEDDEEIGGKFKKLSPEFTIQLAQKTKIHECSFCGSEFSSGQALGGHMRRHRNSSNAKANSSNTITNIAAAVETEKQKQPRRVFQLDLNLPAPPEDDHRDLKFRFEAAAATASALVDCHY